MKKKNWNGLIVSVILFLTFVVWTWLVRSVDVRAIGPQNSSVGFAALNEFVHSVTGVNMTLYTLTDWLGLVPIFVALGFALLGLVQWILRRSFLGVDRSILVLGGFYIAVMAVYVLFEVICINYRPVLIEGYLEASYPSSTTLLTMCVMPTAAMQLYTRIQNRILRNIRTALIIFFTAFMAIGRLVSGVHWVTDIIGGMIISASLVIAYSSIVKLTDR